jgi:hypothetical protein
MSRDPIDELLDDELLSPNQAAIFRRWVAMRDQLRRTSPKSPVLEHLTELTETIEAWAEIYAGASVH